MTKNKGGKHFKKAGHKESYDDVLVLKENEQEYAIVTKLLGDCNVEAECMDGVKRLCHIRGSIKKKCRILLGDTILVTLRSYQDSKADIVRKYSPEHTRQLIEMKLVSKNKEVEDNVEDDVIFDNDVNNDNAFNFDEI